MEQVDARHVAQILATSGICLPRRDMRNLPIFPTELVVEIGERQSGALRTGSPVRAASGRQPSDSD